MARVPSTLVRNWRLKLSALGLSIFLWALVQTEPLSQETFSSVPVRVEMADTGWTLAGVPMPETVELRLGGPAREIIRLAREGTTVRVPIALVSSRDTVVTLQRDWVELGQAAGVTVESVSPPTLRLSFEAATSRTLPISLRTQGELPSDLAFSSDLRVNPADALVHGPESRLSGLDSLRLEPLDLSRIRDSDLVTLAIDTSGLGGASLLPPDVVVGIRVEPKLERSLDGVVVHADFRGTDVQLTVDPPSIPLRLVGARTLVQTIDLSLLRVSVPPALLAGMVPGEARLVRVQVDGVPPLVTAVPATEVVTVTRARDLPEDEEQDPA